MKGKYISIFVPEENGPCHTEEEWADIIVRATNNFNSMLEALKLALSYIPRDGMQDMDRREAIEDIITKAEKGG